MKNIPDVIKEDDLVNSLYIPTAGLNQTETELK